MLELVSLVIWKRQDVSLSKGLVRLITLTNSSLTCTRLTKLKLGLILSSTNNGRGTQVPLFFFPNFKAMDLFSPPKDAVRPFSIEAENQIAEICKAYTKEVGFRREVLNMLRGQWTLGYYRTLPEIKSFVASYWQSIQ